MSPRVRQAKLRKAFSSTALGSLMSRKVVDWAWSLINCPEGRSVLRMRRRSPGSSERVCIIYDGASGSVSDCKGWGAWDVPKKVNISCLHQQ